MIAIVLSDTARWLLFAGFVFIFVVLGFAAFGMWLEDRAPVRDEDEELRSYYDQFRRLPL